MLFYFTIRSSFDWLIYSYLQITVDLIIASFKLLFSKMSLLSLNCPPASCSRKILQILGTSASISSQLPGLNFSNTNENGQLRFVVVWHCDILCLLLTLSASNAESLLLVEQEPIMFLVAPCCCRRGWTLHHSSL